MWTLPKTIFAYLLFKATPTIVNITVYYLFLFYFTLIFYCIIEGASGHTFHYDYTLYM